MGVLRYIGPYPPVPGPEMHLKVALPEAGGQRVFEIAQVAGNYDVTLAVQKNIDYALALKTVNGSAPLWQQIA